MTYLGMLIDKDYGDEGRGAAFMFHSKMIRNAYWYAKRGEKLAVHLICEVV